VRNDDFIELLRSFSGAALMCGQQLFGQRKSREFRLAQRHQAHAQFLQAFGRTLARRAARAFLVALICGFITRHGYSGRPAR